MAKVMILALPLSADKVEVTTVGRNRTVSVLSLVACAHRIWHLSVCRLATSLQARDMDTGCHREALAMLWLLHSSHLDPGSPMWFPPTPFTPSVWRCFPRVAEIVLSRHLYCTAC